MKKSNESDELIGRHTMDDLKDLDEAQMKEKWAELNRKAKQATERARSAVSEGEEETN